MATKVKVSAISPATNGAKSIIAMSNPYRISITVEGTAPFLFHRYDCDSVQEKADAPKNSEAKKTDDVESYVYRDAKGKIGIPHEYFRQATIHSAKYVQDPRSKRKSGMDLFTAGIIVEPGALSLVGRDTWDYLDKRRVVIGMSAVPRVRPALLKGWRATFDFEILLPEYITRDLLLKTVANAGRLIGVGDFRPTYGRFCVIDVAD